MKKALSRHSVIKKMLEEYDPSKLNSTKMQGTVNLLMDDIEFLLRENTLLQKALDVAFLKMRGYAFKIDEKADARDPCMVQIELDDEKTIRTIAEGKSKWRDLPND